MLCLYRRFSDYKSANTLMNKTLFVFLRMCVDRSKVPGLSFPKETGLVLSELERKLFLEIYFLIRPIEGAHGKGMLYNQQRDLLLKKPIETGIPSRKPDWAWHKTLGNASIPQTTTGL